MTTAMHPVHNRWHGHFKGQPRNQLQHSTSDTLTVSLLIHLLTDHIDHRVNDVLPVTNKSKTKICFGAIRVWGARPQCITSVSVNFGSIIPLIHQYCLHKAH
jgi:hypothetical protein